MVDRTLADFNPSGNEQVAEIKELGNKLMGIIDNVCPDARTRALAITNIEQGCMWAVKSFFTKG